MEGRHDAECGLAAECGAAPRLALRNAERDGDAGSDAGSGRHWVRIAAIGQSGFHPIDPGSTPPKEEHVTARRLAYSGAIDLAQTTALNDAARYSEYNHCVFSITFCALPDNRGL